jgi:hypothetical protein
MTINVSGGNTPSPIGEELKMAIRYASKSPIEAGWYICSEDGKLPVCAEATVDGTAVYWSQVGVDYDYWSHDREVYEIDVICKIDPAEIAVAVRKAMGVKK